MKLKDLLVIKGRGESVSEALCKLEMELSEEDYTNLEYNAVYENAISYDGDLEMILSELEIRYITFVDRKDEIYKNVSIKGIEKSKSFVFISDKQTSIIVPMVSEENRHGEDLGDEIFMFFEEIIELPKESIGTCDMCKEQLPKDLLLKTESTTTDKTGEHECFNGMYCPKCHGEVLTTKIR